MHPHEGLPSIRDTVVEAGIAHAQQAFGITIDKDVLKQFYFHIQKQYHEGMPFTKARASVLDAVFAQRTPEDSQKYGAYSGALGKIASLHAQGRKRAARKPRIRTETERIKDHVMLGPDGKQYRFIL